MEVYTFLINFALAIWGKNVSFKIRIYLPVSFTIQFHLHTHLLHRRFYSIQLTVLTFNHETHLFQKLGKFLCNKGTLYG